MAAKVESGSNGYHTNGYKGPEHSKMDTKAQEVFQKKIIKKKEDAAIREVYVQDTMRTKNVSHEVAEAEHDFFA